jgi:DNA uptake protein ComE-like DNA-binding protein
MKPHLKIILALLLIATVKGFSQQADSLTVNQVINEYVSLIAQEEETENVAENLEELAREKININSADYVELSQVPFLDYSDISKIIEYRTINGKYKKLSELKLAGITPYKYNRIKFFLKLEGEKNEDKKIKHLTSELRLRGINKTPEDSDDIFIKSKTYFRLITNYNNTLGFNAVIEKDSKEKNLLDYKTANLIYSSDKIVNKAILGSYVIQFGQGLALWSPYSFSKGSEIKSSTIKSGKILKPYRSTNESKFFNGSAVLINLWKFNLLAFYSDKKYDAVIKEGSFHSISETGIHIDSTDFANANTLKIKLLGSVLEYKREDVRISFLYMKNNFSKTYSPDENQGQLGKSLNYYSLESKFRYKKLFFAGELSYSKRAFAQLFSVNFAFTNSLSIVSVYRNYSQNYFSLWAQGFGEYGKTNNERGFYTGLIYRFPYGKISAYTDFFSTISETELSPFPIRGRDFLIAYQSKKYLESRLYIKVKNENKENYADNGLDTKQKVNISSTKIRAAITSNISKKIKLKTQADISLISNGEKSNGYALSETVILRFNKLFLVGFISFFRTDDYDSRIYLYEYDLDGVFNNSMFYGNGARYYFLIKWKFAKSMSFQLKLSDTYKMFPDYVDLEEDNDSKVVSLQIEYMPRFAF